MMAVSADVLRTNAVQRDKRSQSLARAASRLEALTAWALVGPAAILLVGLFLLPVFAVIVIALMAPPRHAPATRRAHARAPARSDLPAGDQSTTQSDAVDHPERRHAIRRRRRPT